MRISVAAVIELVKRALRNIGAGVLYGIGIGISAGAMIYVVEQKMTASVWNDAALEKLVITKHQEVMRDQAVFILGTVENQGSDAVRAVSIEIDLFGKEGEFVDQCSEYLKGALKPGEARNFKVSCGGCKERPVVAHESYKVRVLGV